MFKKITITLILCVSMFNNTIATEHDETCVLVISGPAGANHGPSQTNDNKIKAYGVCTFKVNGVQQYVIPQKRTRDGPVQTFWGTDVPLVVREGDVVTIEWFETGSAGKRAINFGDMSVQTFDHATNTYGPITRTITGISKLAHVQDGEYPPVQTTSFVVGPECFNADPIPEPEPEPGVTDVGRGGGRAWSLAAACRSSSRCPGG